MHSSATIIDRFTKVPNEPEDALFSRRRHPEVEVRGDALVFPLEINTTNPLFVQMIKNAQNAIYSLVEKDLGLVDKAWNSKELRHQEKSYKRHKKLHLSFMGTVPIGTKDAYEKTVSTRTEEQMQEAKQVINAFVNQKEVISGSVKECKFNPDGHLVIRVDIHSAKALFDCKEKLGKIFGGNYNRYDDPEKQKTLAAVIGVVDYKKISSTTMASINSIIQQLETDLKKLGSIPLSSIEWIVYDKRTLSSNSRLSVLTFDRTLDLNNIHPASLPYAGAPEIKDTEYHPAALKMK